MNWITEQIAIGDWNDAQNISGLQQAGVFWSVNVAQEAHYDVPGNHGLVKYGGVLFGRPIRPLVELINALLARGEKVLVHCGGGANRSPAVVICCLMSSVDEAEARRVVLEKRPGCAPTEDIITRFKQETGRA